MTRNELRTWCRNSGLGVVRTSTMTGPIIVDTVKAKHPLPPGGQDSPALRRLCHRRKHKALPQQLRWCTICGSIGWTRTERDNPEGYLSLASRKLYQQCGRCGRYVRAAHSRQAIYTMSSRHRSASSKSWPMCGGCIATYQRTSANLQCMYPCGRRARSSGSGISPTKTRSSSSCT